MGKEIVVQDLDFFYGDKQALKKINLQLQKGEVLALIGPTGSGKSSFLRILNRMHETVVANTKIQGEVTIGGADILEQDAGQLRRQVGMIFSQPNPFPMSVYENVAYGLKIHQVEGDITEQVERSLRQVGLWAQLRGRLEYWAPDLTLGQQQRLCLARVLALGSDILLLDEPTKSLDPVSTTGFEELLSKLKANHTMLLATNSLQQAGRIADRTAFFLEGELVEEGPTEELFQRPQDPRTEAYLTGRFS